MKKGFSLVESLVVISIIAIVLAVFAFVNNTAKSNAVLDKAQTSLISALQEARNKSASGFGDPNYKYGVRVDQDRITFLEVDQEGNVIEGIQTPLPMGVWTDQEGLKIIFDRLQGTTDDATIILNGGEKTITITKEGRIDYE